MVFYGTKSTFLKAEKVMGEKCPNCKSAGSVNISVFGKYAHIYWIPTFPWKKMVQVSCEHCQRHFSEKELPTNLQTIADEIKGEAKAPVWHFSGLVLLGALVFFMWNHMTSNAKENQEMIAHPMPGDRYKIKTETREHTMFKIKNVTADSVYFLTNQYTVNKMSRVYKIDKAENYMDIGEAFSKKDLLDWFASKKIYDIKR